MTEIGHNGGPSLEAGRGFRKLAWTKARASLLPALPLEVVRIRVKRAKRLGVPYKTYATIRATTGRDIVAFLFSGNALEVRAGRLACPAPVTARLQGLDGAAARLAAVYAPGLPERVLRANPGLFEGAGGAPGFLASWSEMRDGVQGLVQGHGMPADGVVLVSATAIERDWCGAAGLAGVIPAEAFFDARR